MWWFFDSNFFTSLVTLLVGLFAIGLYVKQKRDFKSGIASIILLEIRNAEQAISVVRNRGLENPLNPNDNLLLPNNNWSKYSYLFINNFDVDEWYSITNFINNCLAYDEILLHYRQDIPYQLRQKENHIQSKLVDMGYENLEDKKAYDKKREMFIKNVNEENFTFGPGYYSREIVKILLNIGSSLSTSSVGVKLKQISGLERKRKFLFF